LLAARSVAFLPSGGRCRYGGLPGFFQFPVPDPGLPHSTRHGLGGICIAVPATRHRKGDDRGPHSETETNSGKRVAHAAIFPSLGVECGWTGPTSARGTFDVEGRGIGERGEDVIWLVRGGHMDRPGISPGRSQAAHRKFKTAHSARPDLRKTGGPAGLVEVRLFPMRQFASTTPQSDGFSSRRCEGRLFRLDSTESEAGRFPDTSFRDLW
jgi:hypothetical protein